MAGTTTNISIRMDTELKAQADALFGELGMNISTAFNIFVRQAIREGGIPFKIQLDKPNKETAAAMKFSSEFAFSRYFKRNMGESPRSWMARKRPRPPVRDALPRE